jgi:hypothetical protein
MSEQEPESTGPQPPSFPESYDPAEQPPKRNRPLLLAIVWALAPAVLMILAGLCMELKMDDAFPSLLLFAGVMGGIPALIAWSIWMVYPANWTTPAKVIAVVPIFGAMCALNLFLAFGACAVIDPPFHIQ